MSWRWKPREQTTASARKTDIVFLVYKIIINKIVGLVVVRLSKVSSERNTTTTCMKTKRLLRSNDVEKTSLLTLLNEDKKDTDFFDTVNISDPCEDHKN